MMTGTPMVAALAADTSPISGTSLSDVAGLAIALQAGGKYAFYGTILFTISGALGGYKIGITGPASPSFVTQRMRVFNTSGLALAGIDISNVLDSIAGGLGAGTNSLDFDGFIAVGASAGNFQIQAAQNANLGGSITILKASSLWITPLS